MTTPPNSLFESAFAKTLLAEGGFANSRNDAGGATRYGISESVARGNGYSGSITQLPLETAKEIAKTQYWDALRLDEVALIAPRIAEELFDTAYNCGVDTAGRFLQESLNALNRQGRDYSDVVIDGRLGPATIASLRIYMMMRRKSAGEDVLQIGRAHV